jgi:hypothetical protein
MLTAQRYPRARPPAPARVEELARRKAGEPTRSIAAASIDA